MDTEKNEINPLALSDAEIAAMQDFEVSEIPEEGVEDVIETNEEIITTPTTGDIQNDDEQESEQESTDVQEQENNEESEQEADEEEDVRAEESLEETTEVPVNDTSGDKTDNKTQKSTKTVDTGVDYETEYKKVFAPFRANGRDVQIENADQAISLMQKGAGYNARMAELKPHLKVIKMLENNGLNDVNKISFLIDLDKKNPEAIRKLVKDSKIEPLDIDTEKDSNYIPNDHTVTDAEVELDEVLAAIAQTDTYSNTINVISTKWDQESKKQLYREPAIVKVINEHMGNGLYAEIDAQVHRQKMLGNLDGYSDLRAYTEIATWMGNNKLFKSQATSLNTDAHITPTPITSKSNAPSTEKNQKKKAAGTTKKVLSSTDKKGTVNPLAMSDEEFMKKYS